MQIKELPPEITQLLGAHNAPTRLRKHLQIVYSTAAEMLELLHREWPELQINEKLVLWGAALHDIGKTKHSNELYEPGNRHPEAGHQLLLEKGYADEIARMVLVHEDWNKPDRSLEELLVSLSDVIWNGIRNDELEEFVIQRIALLTGSDFWEVYIKMDAIITQIAKEADDRLAYQQG